MSYELLFTEQEASYSAHMPAMFSSDNFDQ
ncbi:hypothetical protein LAUMK42_04768 [Mycobacterium persicum]|uniref:Uncharacterized protein n=1 Tax=Mycobacterium persicum TaxID=1487726 RepID=A0AB38UZY6_9MYCO|nr:hypothetical protein LAUMK42_04768 [Mycobacterium persicum]